MNDCTTVRLYDCLTVFVFQASEKHLNTTATFVTLPGLKAWTRYCVSVQSREDGEHRKSSIFSHPHCLETEGEMGGLGLSVNCRNVSALGLQWTQS